MEPAELERIKSFKLKLGHLRYIYEKLVPLLKQLQPNAKEEIPVYKIMLSDGLANSIHALFHAVKMDASTDWKKLEAEAEAADPEVIAEEVQIFFDDFFERVLKSAESISPLKPASNTEKADESNSENTTITTTSPST